MKTKTYAERRKEKPFDWNEFLNKEIIQHTRIEMIQAKKLASDWVTCACGNQCDIIPRNSEGAPEDKTLFYLGLDFSVQMNFIDIWHANESAEKFNLHRRRAHLVLQKIEKRSAELIAEMQEGVNK